MDAPSFKLPRRALHFVGYSMSALLIVSALLSGSGRAIPADPEFTTQTAAGDLDPGFGNGGKVVTDFSGNDDIGSAVAIEPDGKIVVGGTSTPQGGNSDFAICRYNVDGSPDSSFGSNGRVLTDFFHDKDRLGGIAIQPDGKIVAVGSAIEPGVGTEFALARYNLDGSPDPSFGSGGKTVTRFPEDAEAAAVALTAAGRIVAVGTASMRIQPRFALARYNSDGSLDASFGTNGIVVNTMHTSEAHAVALQPDNKILITGADAVAQNFVLFRYNSNGSPDNSFGIGGKVISGSFLISRAQGVALQADGKIVVAGWGQTSIFKALFGVSRHNTNGSFDGSFGNVLLGSVRTSISSRDDRAKALAIQSNGKIIVAGLAGAPSDVFQGFADFAVVRYKSRGKLDNSFGSFGKVVTDFFGGSDGANAIALQTDGKIVLAGTVLSSTNDFAIARYLVEDFVLRFDPPIVNAARGTTVSVDLLIDHIGGFEGIVTVTPPDLSTIGVTLKPADQIVTTHSKKTLNFKIRPTAQVGLHLLTFKAQDEEGRARNAVLRLTIQ